MEDLKNLKNENLSKKDLTYLKELKKHLKELKNFTKMINNVKVVDKKENN
jgi:hypothetical protein